MYRQAAEVAAEVRGRRQVFQHWSSPGLRQTELQAAEVAVEVRVRRQVLHHWSKSGLRQLEPQVMHHCLHCTATGF